MKIFLDFEFTGLHKFTTPVSLGIIAENGKEFYAEFTDYDREQVNDWIEDNVINNTLYLRYPLLVREELTLPKDHYWGEASYIVTYLQKWLDQFGFVEVWLDCGSYDWVLLCDLFGGALKLPRNIYYIPFDVCTVFKLEGLDPDTDRGEFIGDVTIPRFAKCPVLGRELRGHNALDDARTLKACYEKLIGID